MTGHTYDDSGYIDEVADEDDYEEHTIDYRWMDYGDDGKFKCPNCRSTFDKLDEWEVVIAGFSTPIRKCPKNNCGAYVRI